MFVDLEKQFGFVFHKFLWLPMRKIGVEEWVISTLAVF